MRRFGSNPVEESRSHASDGESASVVFVRKVLWEVGQQMVLRLAHPRKWQLGLPVERAVRVVGAALESQVRD